MARSVLADHNATSSFLNYGAEWGYPPYPATVCISVNEAVVHGIPDSRRLAAGDIVSIDFGAIVAGWHGDAARTFCVGEVRAAAATLVEQTRQAMWAGIATAARAARVGDISHAIEQHAKRAPRRFGVVREYTGHGIGTSMHQPPDVPNHGRPRRGARLSRHVPGDRTDLHAWFSDGGDIGRRLDRGHPRRFMGRALGEHCRAGRRWPMGVDRA